MGKDRDLEELLDEAEQITKASQINLVWSMNDFETEAPDGIHELRWEYGDNKKKIKGVLVQDGQIDPRVAFKAIALVYNLVAFTTKGGIPARYFIEKIEWKGDHFTVYLGS